MTDRGEYRGIYTALPHDPDFQELSAEARACFYPLKLECGLSGIAVCYTETIARLSGYPLPTVSEALSELEAKDWIVRERNVIWIRNGLRFEPSHPLNNRNNRQGVVNHIGTLPKLAIVNDFARYYELEIPFPETPNPNPPRTVSKHPSNKGEGEREKEKGNTEKGKHPVVAALPAESSRASEPAPVRGNDDDRVLAVQLEEQVRAFAIDVFGEGSAHLDPFIRAAKRVTDPALDLEAWRNGTGASVPFADRPRILALALARWDQQGRRDPLRGCVKYEVLQQTDPFPSPVAGSQAASVRNEKPKDRSAPRGDRPAKLSVSDGGALDPVELEMQAVARWEKSATKAEIAALQKQAADEIAAEPSTGPLVAAMGPGHAQGRVVARYRKLVMERIGRAA